MSKIKHNRPTLRIIDNEKKTMSEESQLLEEDFPKNPRTIYVPDVSKARTSHGPTVFKNLIETIEQLIKTQNEQSLITLINFEVAVDRCLLIQISNKIIQGIEFSLSMTGRINIKKIGNHIELRENYADFKKLAMKNKGFRSKACRELIQKI